MAKLSDIYGTDPIGMASDISSDALTNTAGTEEYWSRFSLNETKGSQGVSKPHVNPDVDTTSGVEGDSRAKTSGNHGEQS